MAANASDIASSFSSPIEPEYVAPAQGVKRALEPDVEGVDTAVAAGAPPSASASPSPSSPSPTKRARLAVDVDDDALPPIMRERHTIKDAEAKFAEFDALLERVGAAYEAWPGQSAGPFPWPAEGFESGRKVYTPPSKPFAVDRKALREWAAARFPMASAALKARFAEIGNAPDWAFNVLRNVKTSVLEGYSKSCELRLGDLSDNSAESAMVGIAIISSRCSDFAFRCLGEHADTSVPFLLLLFNRCALDNRFTDDMLRYALIEAIGARFVADGKVTADEHKFFVDTSLIGSLLGKGKPIEQ